MLKYNDYKTVFIAQDQCVISQTPIGSCEGKECLKFLNEEDWPDLVSEKC